MHFHHSQLDHHGPTNRLTDGWTDKASYRDAWTHLKRNIGLNILVNGDIRFLALVASLEYWIEHSSQWQYQPPCNSLNGI